MDTKEFLAYLQGIETDEGGNEFEITRKFLAYLQGIETAAPFLHA